MKTKLFEIRDRATFISAIGISVSALDGFLARRAGYGNELILLGNLHGGQFRYNASEWCDRTWTVAHAYIAGHWNTLKSGAVIDVEYILGETLLKKRSESEGEFYQEDENGK